MCRSLDPEIWTIGKQFVVVGKRDETVEEARGRYRQADARFLRQEPGRRRRVTGIALVTEADVADARRLRDTGYVGDRDADHTVDCPDVVEFEGIDNQVVSIGEFGSRVGRRCCFRCRAHVRMTSWCG